MNHPPRRHRSRHRWIVITSILLLCLVLVRCFVLDVYRIGGDAMAPSYRDGQIVFVLKLGAPKVGDVVLYESTHQQKDPIQLIGFVTAAPGDNLYSLGGDFYINGKLSTTPSAMKHSYQAASLPRYELHIPRLGDTISLNQANLLAYRSAILSESNGKATFAQGECFIGSKSYPNYRFSQDYYWILSENANSGPDSRHLGVIPLGNILGRVFWAL